MARTVRGPYLITTAPTLTQCRTCRRPVLAATVAGLDRHVGTECLNDMGELVALLAGRHTYELVGDELVPRSAARIANVTAPLKPVLADHGCGPVPLGHIDVRFSAIAAALVVRALGGVMVGARGPAEPPF